MQFVLLKLQFFYVVDTVAIDVVYVFYFNFVSNILDTVAAIIT